MSNAKQKTKRQSKEQQVLALLDQRTYVTDGKNLYMESSITGGREQYVQVPSSGFSAYVSKVYFDLYGQFPSKTVLQGITAVITQKKRSQAKSIAMHRRFGTVGEDSYVDMGKRNTNETIVVNSNGWSVQNTKCCEFILEPSMKELAMPQGGSSDPFLLFKYLNIHGQEYMLLVLAWLCSLVLGIEHPILLFQGAHASGKTSAAERIRSLFDPASPMEMSIPTKEEDLALAFYKNAVCFFDNVGKLSKKVSDMFCKAVTGAGHSKRALFTDSEQVFYEYKRPILMTSICLPTNAEDFLSRCMIIPMTSILSANRVSESELDNMFEQDLPEILGGVLDLTVKALSLKQYVKLNNRTRMGDFDEFGCAICLALNINPQKFIKARLEIEKSACLSGDDAEFLHAIERLVSDNGGALDMTAADMAEDIANRMGEELSVLSLGKKLSKHQETLENVGISYDKSRSASIVSYKMYAMQQDDEDLVEILPHCATCLHLNTDSDTETICNAYGKSFEVPEGPISCSEYCFFEMHYVDVQMVESAASTTDYAVDMASLFESISENSAEDDYLYNK